MAVLGISIEVRSSVFSANPVTIWTYTDEVTGYKQTIDAMGGYKKASFSLALDLIDIEAWIDEGLGLEIVVRDEAGLVIWNGFVNKISAMIGGRSLERGPLMDTCNRMVVMYNPLDNSVSPPASGATTYTTAVNDAVLQAKYGILGEVYSAGDITRDEATLVRDTLLAEFKYPETNESLTTESPGSLAISVDCLGYIEYLNKYTYSNLATGTVNLSAKIQAVLAADPNALFTADYSGLTANTYQVSAAEASSRKAIEVINGEVAKGDISNQRYTFGIYANRRAIYAPLPTDYAYQFSLSNSDLALYGGGELLPWDILPARWLFYTDFMPGRIAQLEKRNDPRVLLIESVTFTAPWGISINGGKVSNAQQLLARLGIGGI